MKLNKTQLKKILKEVVRELVDEGAFDRTIQECVGPRANSGRSNGGHLRRPAANDFADSFGGAPGGEEHQTPFGAVGQMTPNSRLQTLSRVAAAEASGGDTKQAQLMEAIFADTATTTLQNQLGYESHGSAGIYTGGEPNPEEEQREMATLDALSGGRGAKHWAAIAFAGRPKE